MEYIMNILGVRIDNLEKKEILEKIENFLTEEKFHQIATVNPEFIMQAQKDEEYKNILNSCDLNIADGMGIRFAFWRYGEKLKARIAGADLFWEILKMADEKNLSVYLIANSEGLSMWEKTAEAIKGIYPNLKIGGVNISISTVIARSKTTKQSLNNSDEIAALLSIARNDVIFCSFGAPYQEKFLHSLKNQKNAKIRLAMGVGGSFDFATGKLRRAPLWMRKTGLEWLFRLIQQPKRIKKIFNAVIIFPIKIIFK